MSYDEHESCDKKIVKLEKDNASLKALLKELEWKGEGRWSGGECEYWINVCPCCRGDKPNHKEDCKLSEAIKEISNE